MAYHYGGKMNPIKKKRIMKGIACSMLALSVFSSVSSAFAWHFVPWIYHLPTSTSDSAQEKFNWNEVKGIVDNGLNNLEKEERKQYGSNYYVDKIYSSNGKNYTWESYQWDWSSEGGGKIIISHFDFDTVGGTIATWRKYGEGDWVKERPPGWPYGDDFAMYKRLFSSTIPIRDQADSSKTSIWHNLVNARTGATNIISMLKQSSDAQKDSTAEKIKKGQLDYKNVALSLLKGDYGNIINKIRNPKGIFNQVEPYVMNAKTSVNLSQYEIVDENGKPIGGNNNSSSSDDVGSSKYKISDKIPLNETTRGYIYSGFNGLQAKYTKEEIEKGTKIIEDREKFLQKTDDELHKVYENDSKDSETSAKDMEKLSHATSNDGKESITDAKTREEQLHRMEFAMDRQKEKVAQAQANRDDTADSLNDTAERVGNRKGENMAHMPTTGQMANEVKERREKYSTSKDLGWPKFGQGKKSDFSKILSDVLNPNYKEKEQEKKKMKEKQQSTQGSSNNGNSGVDSSGKNMD